MIEIRYNDEFMKRAMRIARQAAGEGEVPVGCVIVRDGKTVAEGMNSVEREQNALRHAEINALESAMDKLGERILPGCDVYVTLEPCPMCAGAIRNAGCANIFFGAYDAEKGGCLSKWNVTGDAMNVFGGYHADECSAILKEFFGGLRTREDS